MKRFVTYLYECERGNKTKNTGFIRVNVRGEETVMEVYIRNFLRSNCVGKLYVLIYKKNLLGIELGEIAITDGQKDERFTFQTNNMKESGYSLNEIIGIGIRLNNNAYIASCWVDEYEEEILRGEFEIPEEAVANVELDVRRGEVSETSEVQLAVAEEHHLQEQTLCYEQQNFQTNKDQYISYEKIDLSQIRDLPSPNWHLCNNSFLVHGFWNYGYLVLKKEMEESKEKFSLGVPGIFEKPEMVMAVVFGFSQFEATPQEMVEVEMNVERKFSHKEKNQEPKVGAFGCWFTELRK